MNIPVAIKNPLGNVTLEALRLNDEAIRSCLIKQLTQMAKRPKAILEELRVHHGNAIADVVSIHEHPHCYEIKGSTDNIYRALKQSYFYERSFKKMTLVTVARHVASAERIMPPYWGIMTAKIDSGKMKLAYTRSAKINPRFDKTMALHTLWKSELLDSDEAKIFRGAKNLNRDQLTRLIAESLSEEALLKFIAAKLIDRAINPESLLA